jgi:predicted acetyltransferase
MEIRVLTKEEEKACFPLWSQAFEYGRREMSAWEDWPDDATEGGSYTCGVFDAEGLQATVLVNDYRVHLGPEVIVPMGGIGGVACLPASRGKGYAGACLQYALERMKETGHVVSTLFPFSWDYYRRFGWEWVGVDRKYAVPTRILRPDPETENVRAATPADRPAIADAYRQFATQFRGAVARNEKAWNAILDDRKDKFTYTYLYAQDEQPEGYLTYRGGKEEETWLREFICLTPRAQRGLLGLLRRHEMQVNKFAWSAPDSDPLWSHFFHWDIETKVKPVTQGRVVDVPAALRAWRPKRERRGAVTLAIQDESAPWNTGSWRVEFEGGEVSVRPTQDAAQVSLDIQALSQAYFGTPTADEIRAAERLMVHDEYGFAALRDLLDGPPMWINDDF